MTPEEQLAQDKLDAKDRGIGRAKAHIYLEDGIVNVSMSDYFEGETVAIVVNPVNQDGTLGAAVSGNPVEQCGGKVQGFTLKTCATNDTYTLPEGETFRVSITYATIEKTADISAENKSGWLDWSE